MPRFELPPDLTPEEERAVLAALEQVFEHSRTEVPRWALAGRVEALRLGALQARRDAGSGWGLRAHAPFARRGTSPLVGRGDAK